MSVVVSPVPSSEFSYFTSKLENMFIPQVVSLIFLGLWFISNSLWHESIALRALFLATLACLLWWLRWIRFVILPRRLLRLFLLRLSWLLLCGRRWLLLHLTYFLIWLLPFFLRALKSFIITFFIILMLPLLLRTWCLLSCNSTFIHCLLWLRSFYSSLSHLILIKTIKHLLPPLLFLARDPAGFPLFH